MCKKIISIFILLSFIIPGCKQGSEDQRPEDQETNADVGWIFGIDSEEEHVVEVLQTYDGAYLVLGYKGICCGNAGYLLKVNPNGDEMWSKTLHYDHSVHGSSVQQTTDSGYIIVGSEVSDGGPDSDRIILLKTDVNGNQEWSKAFEEGDGKSVQQTSDGGYIITGFSDQILDATYNQDIVLIKTDVNGDLVWSTSFFDEVSYESGKSVKQTQDGGYIVLGFKYAHGTNPSSDPTIYLLKTDPLGEEVWSQTFSGDEGWEVVQSDDRGFILIGSIDGFVLLIKTDLNGNEVWSKTTSQKVPSLGRCSVKKTLDGCYIAVGSTTPYTSSDFYLLKFSSDGNEIWHKTYGDPQKEEYGYLVQQTSDGGYIIAGEIEEFWINSDLTYFYDTDILLIKTDSNGNL